MSDDMAYVPGAVGGLHVEADEGVAADEIERIKQSIAAMARSSLESGEREREFYSKADALSAAVAAPLQSVIQADSGAMDKIASADAQMRRHVEELDRSPAPPVDPPPDLAFDAPLGGIGRPFHFLWHWHSGQPAPELPALDRSAGFIDVDARTGTSGDRSIVHHAGFGISKSVAHPTTMTARTVRQSIENFNVGAALGGSATVEGGIEMTVIENGTLIRHGVDKRFRRRLSVGEHVFGPPGAWSPGNPIQLTFPMLPGSRYEINVGAWVFCATDQGFPGLSHAAARVRATVFEIG